MPALAGSVANEQLPTLLNGSYFVNLTRFKLYQALAKYG